MSVPKAQQDPILRGFDLRRSKISLKGGRLSIVAPTSMEPLVAKMTELDDRRRNERMPFWAEIWPSSVGLARWLARSGNLDGCSVLDLGCGVGVAGAAAAWLGAAEVEFADFFEEALAFAVFNARENQAGTPAIGSRLFDWTKDRLDRRFDRVLAGDILYEPRYHEPIRVLLSRVLAEEGEAVLVDPCRSVADPFFETLTQSFDVEIEDLETTWPDRATPLRLARIRA
ncbi:MAG: methyltransferase [Planctomycetes bacterium]|nr:methyltransferase [Planctomycetota bacterium]MCB9919415.1 methyltransferase [Planctomycetota bacterium]